MPGPIPRRDEENTRPRSRRGAAGGPTVQVGELRPTKDWLPDPDWHPIAISAFESFKNSGQSDWFQDSDWAFLFTLCDDLSRYKRQEDRADEGTTAYDRWNDMSEDERVAAGMDAKKPPRGFGRGGSANKLTTIYDGFSRLMMTEGDRRRLHVELRRPKPPAEEDPKVAQMDEYRRQLGQA